jgi:hypothetical protein
MCGFLLKYVDFSGNCVVSIIVLQPFEEEMTMTTELSEADRPFLEWEQGNCRWFSCDSYITFYLPTNPLDYRGPLYSGRGSPVETCSDGLTRDVPGYQQRFKLTALEAFSFNTPLVAQRLTEADINFETAIVLIDILAKQLLLPSFKDRVPDAIPWNGIMKDNIVACHNVLFTYIDICMKKVPSTVEYRTYPTEGRWLYHERGGLLDESEKTIDCGRYIGGSVGGAARWSVNHGYPPLTDEMKYAMNGFVELAHRYGLGMNYKYPFPDLPYWLPDNVGSQSAVGGALAAPRPA